MLSSPEANGKALLNITGAIDASLGFPCYVFRQRWERFYFFDSDWMFGPEFVGIVHGLLDAEGSSAALITGFDAPAPSSFPIERGTDTARC